MRTEYKVGLDSESFMYHYKHLTFYYFKKLVSRSFSVEEVSDII